jgi:hypothetical protein
MPAKKQWLFAREIWGLEGVEPLSTYDMGAAGLQGCVTAKGWHELGNPGSMSLCLKQFSPTNIGSSSGYSKRFSLADGETAINVGDDLKEIADMESFDLAMRALCHAARMAMHWNYSFAALDGFLRSSKYGQVELAGCTNKVAELVNFVNHVLGLNAQNWIAKEPFLSAPDLKGEFAMWVQSRPSIPSTLAAGAPQTASGSGSGKPWGKYIPGKGNYTQSTGNYTQGQGSGWSSRGGAKSGGYQKNTGQRGGGRNVTGGSGQSNMSRIICRDWNLGHCNKHFSACTVQPSGAKAWHICNVVKANGFVCGSYHPAIHHK